MSIPPDLIEGRGYIGEDDEGKEVTAYINYQATRLFVEEAGGVLQEVRGVAVEFDDDLFASISIVLLDGARTGSYYFERPRRVSSGTEPPKPISDYAYRKAEDPDLRRQLESQTKQVPSQSATVSENRSLLEVLEAIDPEELTKQQRKKLRRLRNREDRAKNKAEEKSRKANS